ncbi:MAG: hypothetical protein NT150_04800 [Bacteroidetes bacterium]|nr:hypothetical protein [Bacteroidota bacterium]
MILKEAKNNLGWIHLEKPLRHGYYKELEFREEVLKRKEAPVFLEILEATKVVKWGITRKRLEKSWVEQSKRTNRIQYPGLKAFVKKEFDGLSEKAKKYFIKRQRDNCFLNDGEILYFSTLPVMYFNFKVSRAYIYKRRIIDSVLDKEMKWINHKLETDYYGMFYGPSSTPKWWKKYQFKKEKRRVNGLLTKRFFDGGNQESKIYDRFKVLRW